MVDVNIPRSVTMPTPHQNIALISDLDSLPVLCLFIMISDDNGMVGLYDDAHAVGAV